MYMPGVKLPGMISDELWIILSGIYCPFGMAYRKEKECFITHVMLSYKQHLTSWIEVKKYKFLGV